MVAHRIVMVKFSLRCMLQLATVYMYHLSINAKQNKPIRFSGARCQSLNGLLFLWCKNWIGFIFYRFIASIFYMIVQSELVFFFRSTVIVANPFCFPLIFMFNSHFACLHFNGHLSTNTHIKMANTINGFWINGNNHTYYGIVTLVTKLHAIYHPRLAQIHGTL